MVSSLRHRKTLARVSVHSFPCCRPSSTISIAGILWLICPLNGFHRPALEILHVIVILFFLGFYCKKTENRNRNQRIRSYILCLQMPHILIPCLIRTLWNLKHTLPNILCKISHVWLLPGLEGNDAEGTLGRETFPVPSISSRLWSNSTWTSSSSSANSSSCVRVIKDTFQNIKLAGILMVPTSNNFHFRTHK